MLTTALALLLPALPQSTVFSGGAAQATTIDHVDVYGLRRVTRAQLDERLGLFPGAPADLDREALAEELRAMDGVVDARVILMMAPGSAIALVGILEEGTPTLELRPAPTGDATLPPAFHEVHDALTQATLDGLRSGVAGEDHAAGHALSDFPPAREQEERLAALTTEHLERVRRVLREAADARERSIAAQAIAYHEDKAAIVDDLARAVTDADSGVRNNAVRALSVLAEWANGQDGFELDLDPTPFVTMLDSLEWTDRNKAAALLMALTEDRDPELLAALRERALPALEEMARWHSAGHAFFSLQILGRVAGLSDEEIHEQTLALRGRPWEERAAWVDELVNAALDRD